jgi:hypothetical protein
MIPKRYKYSRSAKRWIEIETLPTTSRRRSEPFVQVPVRWAGLMTRAAKSPKAFVGLWLLHLAWKAKSHTVMLPNAKLEAYGVSRLAKYRALRDFEQAGLIRVDWRKRKTPRVTLLHL